MEIEDLEAEIPRLEAALAPTPMQNNASGKSATAKERASVNSEFDYAASSLADIDFPMPDDHKITEIVRDLRIPTWHVQGRAIDAMFKLKWKEVTPNEAFVLGRNLNQVACGGEFKAEAILRDLRRELARIPDDWAVHIVNGLFYEIYFNHTGEFRGAQHLKSKYMDQVFELEKVAKYAGCVEFIRSALEFYRDQIGVLPSPEPELLVAHLKVKPGDPSIIKSIKCNGKEQLIEMSSDDDDSPRTFTVRNIRDRLQEFWRLPSGHFEIKFETEMYPSTKLKIIKTKTLGVLQL